MGLVEDELWSVEPDFGRIVTLCARRALRGKVMGFAPTRVKIMDKTDMGSLTAKPEDVLVLFEHYDGDPDTGIPVLVGVRVRRPYVRRCSALWRWRRLGPERSTLTRTAARMGFDLVAKGCYHTIWLASDCRVVLGLMNPTNSGKKRRI